MYKYVQFHCSVNASYIQSFQLSEHCLVPLCPDTTVLYTEASLKSDRVVQHYSTQNSFDVVIAMYIINKLNLMLVAN